jgi:hypothetical protein
LNYLAGLNQYLSNVNNVQFRDLTLKSREQVGVAYYVKTYIRSYTNAGSDLFQMNIYSDDSKVANFNCTTDGSIYSPCFEFYINSNKALEIYKTRNILINGATSESSAYGAITIKQGTDPTSSSADQLSIFATSGANCTLGLRTEASVVTESATPTSTLIVNINGTNYKLLLEEV